MTESTGRVAGDGAVRAGRKRRWLWVVGAIVAIIAAYVGWNIFDSYVLLGESTITVSPETTYITEPLNADGTVNYTQALIDRYSEGVTPDNNAMTLLVQAFDADKFLPEETRAEILRQLGLTEADLAAGKKYVSWRDYLEALGLDRTDIDLDYDLLQRLSRRPWAAEDHPEVAAWLADNAEPLAIMRQAARRTHNYFPIVSTDDPPCLLSVSIQKLALYRDAGRALAVRAMLHLANGDIADARTDADTIHRLGRTPHPFLIWNVINAYMVESATDVDRAIIASGKLSPDAMRAMLAECKARPPMPALADAFEGEHMFALDMTMDVYRAADVSELGEYAGLVRHADRSIIDWDSVLRRINAHHREQIRSATEFTYAEHRVRESQVLKELEQDLAEGMKHIKLKLAFYTLTCNKRAARKAFTRAFAPLILSMTTPDLARIQTLDEQARTRKDLTLLALAAKVYQADNGDWPGQLADLAPEYLDAIPDDRFTDQPLMYVRTDDAVRIYSLGANMTDDGGMNITRAYEDNTADCPAGTDDIAIELR